MGATQFNLAEVFDAVAAALPDRDGARLGRPPLDVPRAGRPQPPPGHLPAVAGPRRPHRAGRAGRPRVRPGPPRASTSTTATSTSRRMLGAFRARVAPFNVNYRYVEDELVYLLDNAGCRALVYHADLRPHAGRDARPAAGPRGADPGGRRARATTLLPGAVDYEAVARRRRARRCDVEPSPDDLYILYTGGTTGMPKGVLWRQHDIFMSAMGGRNILDPARPSTSYDELSPNARSFADAAQVHDPAAAHARRRPVGVVHRPQRRRTRRVPARHPPPRPRRRAGAPSSASGATTITVVGDAVARPLVEELERGDYDISSLFSRRQRRRRRSRPPSRSGCWPSCRTSCVHRLGRARRRPARR